MNKFVLGLVNLVQFFRRKNWTIVQVQTLVHETKVKLFHYVYNGKVYRYIGDVLPSKVSRGFCAPIKYATWNGRDVTDYIKIYSGPRNDFFGSDPPLEFMFFSVRAIEWLPTCQMNTNGRIGVFIRYDREVVVEPEEGTLEITNVLGQTSVFGAKKNLISPKLATE
jgi:hypothetical protein